MKLLRILITLLWIATAIIVSAQVEDPAETLSGTWPEEVHELLESARTTQRPEDAALDYSLALELLESAVGPEHPDLAFVLTALGNLLVDQARYDEAGPLLERSLAIRERALGPDHPLVAESLDGLARLFYWQRRYAEAEALYRRALALREAAYDSDHLEIGAALNNLGELYMSQGRHDEAAELYRRALAIHERAYGPEHGNVATILYNLAQVYSNQARHADAMSLNERALAIAEKAFGPEHPTVASILVAIASGYASTGEYAAAEPLYLRALDIEERTRGEAHPEVAYTLNHLVWLYSATGRYADVERMLARAREIQEAAFGPDHPDYATALNNLASFYQHQGRYREAESLYQRALEINERALGSMHPDLATVVNNLAILYTDQGRYDQAQSMTHRVLRIYRQAYGEEHPALANPLNSLAVLAAARGDLAEAETLFRRAAVILEQALGPEHADLAPVLNNLGDLYTDQARYDAAEQKLNRALAIREMNHGAVHPVVTESLDGLSRLYRSQGRYAEALPPAERALAIQEEAFGPEHPKIAETLHGLGRRASELGDYENARRLLERAIAIREAALSPDHVLVGTVMTSLARAHFGPGREPPDTIAFDMIDRAIGILDAQLALPAARADAYALRARMQRAANRPEAAIRDLEEALRTVEELRPQVGGGEETRAGFFERYADQFDLMVAWQVERGNLAAAFEYSERGRARVLLDQLAAGKIDLRAGIPEDIRAPLEARESTARAMLAEYQQRMTMIRARRDLSDSERLEKLRELESLAHAAQQEFVQVFEEIRNASPLWRDLITSGGQPVPLSLAQRRLVPRAGLLLSFHLGNERSHLFLIPPPGRQPQAFELELPGALASQHDMDAGPLNSANLLLVLAGAGAEALTSRDMRDLARHPGLNHDLWRILLPDAAWAQIAAADEVVLIPDGLLHLLPFEMLITELDAESGIVSYWLDRGPAIRYASSATSLYQIEQRPFARRLDAGAVLSLSDAVYDPQEVAALKDMDESLREAARRTDDDPMPADMTRTRMQYERAGGVLVRLPGTVRESEAVREAFAPGGEAIEVKVLSGLDASEQALRGAIAGKRYLHLATHGLVDQGGAFFSALALTPPVSDSSEPDNDGFLHLHEIFELRLPDLELAVLSACETNVGLHVRGEGVFALSRGFLAAGARRVVASQWPVEDTSTARLIGDFFRTIAEKESAGEPVNYATALRDAKRALRAEPRWAEPFFWAPFILIGKQ